MLKIFFMAVLSLKLVPYSIQDVRNTSSSLPPPNSTSTDNGAQRITSEFRNQTIFTTPNFNWMPTSNSTALPIKKKVKKKRIIKKKRKSKSVDNVPAHSRNYEVKMTEDLQPKSNMQILQFYAQPLNTVDLNVQPVSTYDYDALAASPNAFSSLNQHSLFVANTNYVTAIPTVDTLPPTVATLPYKTLPQNEYVINHGSEVAPKPFSIKHINYNWNAPPIEPHHFKHNHHHHHHQIPIVDPYNLYGRPIRPVKYRGPPVHGQKIIATAKPLTSAVSMVPPVSVTHVYKYTEDTGLKLPFLQSDDSLDDSIPILSAALNEHLHERVTNVGMKNYLTPPKLGQPFLYNVPQMALQPLNNELHLIQKYNAELQNQIRDAAQQNEESDELNETQEEKNYTDEDLKKALTYIQNLKRDKTKRGRGSKKFKDGDESGESKSPRKNKKKTQDDADIEDEEDDDGDARRTKKKKRKKPKKEHIFEEDEDFQLEPFGEDDKNQEESQKTVVKAERKDHEDREQDQVRSQESQIVPSVEDENSDFNFEGADANIGNGDSDERVEFQMHGLKGPESYKFGYDTGKGENRQFRYEERDPEGRVKGHFGYYDKDGKLQVFNYEADPENGYHLEKASE